MECFRFDTNAWYLMGSGSIDPTAPSVTTTANAPSQKPSTLGFGTSRLQSTALRPNEPFTQPEVTVKMGGGPRVAYPKHVWSPAGGWYARPSNWKANTAVSLVAIAGVTAMVWKISADLEHRPRMPEKGRFYPSRYWSKQVIEHERREREKESKAGEQSP